MKTNIPLIKKYLSGKPWQYRLKLADRDISSNWSKWILNPSGEYIETENSEPVLISEIEWIEINPIENKKIGRLVPDKTINHSSEICQMLDNLNIEYCVDNGIVKIPTNRLQFTIES
ncbi:DUF6678 family protein [Parabacteroides sp. FAFU027]|uniref:DUF6678 family protein n=1 Tax=Parabacteroides sp. FAFU027 TaxID=2922715 RepID=UPI001FAFB365|nr:DUF6678 family protein [Parabacteroides sp. FAFU027]